MAKKKHAYIQLSHDFEVRGWESRSEEDEECYEIHAQKRETNPH